MRWGSGGRSEGGVSGLLRTERFTSIFYSARRKGGRNKRSCLLNGRCAALDCQHFLLTTSLSLLLPLPDTSLLSAFLLHSTARYHRRFSLRLTTLKCHHLKHKTCSICLDFVSYTNVDIHCEIVLKNSNIRMLILFHIAPNPR